MKILMMSNTYTPIVGGLEESIRLFCAQLRSRGHRVLIVVPAYKDAPKDEDGVIRLPALQKFNKTDFSVSLPIPGILTGVMKDFKPDIIHSHHPFLMGDLALRVSSLHHAPLVFTYHTMYEQYIHYLPVQNELVKRFVEELSAGYANLADRVIVPSRSVYDILLQRGVEASMRVIPTGIDASFWARGNGENFRRRCGIAGESFVVGTVGRLATEKNLEFLSRAVGRFLKEADRKAVFLVVGDGPYKEEIEKFFGEKGLSDRLIMTGKLRGEELRDAYHAMDVFAFASQTETQGLVVTEALASGTPVVAVDASGVRDSMKDGVNGWLLAHENEEAFAGALAECARMPAVQMAKLKKACVSSIKDFSLEVCAGKIIHVYQEVIKEGHTSVRKRTRWRGAMKRVKTEWDMLKNLVEAGGRAIKKTASKRKNVRLRLKSRRLLKKKRLQALKAQR